jgi:MFS transporter, ACS family, hexuronate transporter
MHWSRPSRSRRLIHAKELLASARPVISHYRWVICALLFVATSINYVDRQIIGVLKPTLQAQFGWSESAFGSVIFWFTAAYALGYMGFGRLIDKIGVRFGYAAVVILWTAAHMAHALVNSIGGFIAVRFVLGLGESGNFPAGLKAIAEWFPKRERALATGIFVAGSNIGAIITPLIVPFVVYRWGWRAAFIVTGAFSAVWLAAWWRMYRSPAVHPKVSLAEWRLINEEAPAAVLAAPAERIRWGRLLMVRETWAYALGRFLIDPVWWMFLFWLPDFFAKRYGLDLAHFGPPLVVVYLLSDLGSVSGGWLSSTLIRRGATVNRARKLTMVLASVMVMPVMFAVHADNVWLAVAIVGLATAGHQAFSANLYTFPSDVFLAQAVASVVGIGGTAGALGAMLMAKYAGWVLDSFGSYTPIFAVAGSVYLIALASIQLLAPRMEMAASR